MAKKKKEEPASQADAVKKAIEMLGGLDADHTKQGLCSSCDVELSAGLSATLDGDVYCPSCYEDITNEEHDDDDH